jgi:hypothetical protein
MLSGFIRQSQGLLYGHEDDHSLAFLRDDQRADLMRPSGETPRPTSPPPLPASHGT